MTSFLQKWYSQREKIPFTMPPIAYVGFLMNWIFANGAFRMRELRVLHRDPLRMSNVDDAMLQKTNAMARAKNHVCFFRTHVSKRIGDICFAVSAHYTHTTSR